MSTRLKEKEEEVGFVDYKLLKKGIARLENVKKNVTIEVNSETKKLSDLVQQGINVKTDSDKLIADAKTKADGIIAKAKERESKIIGLESELKGKIGNAEEAKRQSDSQIKSNQGKEKNLEVSKETVAQIKAKLVKVSDMIKDVI